MTKLVVNAVTYAKNTESRLITRTILAAICERGVYEQTINEFGFGIRISYQFRYDSSSLQ